MLVISFTVVVGVGGRPWRFSGITVVLGRADGTGVESLAPALVGGAGRWRANGRGEGRHGVFRSGFVGALISALGTAGVTRAGELVFIRGIGLCSASAGGEGGGAPT